MLTMKNYHLCTKLFIFAIILQINTYQTDDQLYYKEQENNKEKKRLKKQKSGKSYDITSEEIGILLDGINKLSPKQVNHFKTLRWVNTNEISLNSGEHQLLTQLMKKNRHKLNSGLTDEDICGHLCDFLIGFLESIDYRMQYCTQRVDFVRNYIYDHEFEIEHILKIDVRVCYRIINYSMCDNPNPQKG